jgi:hypothetical protein
VLDLQVRLALRGDLAAYDKALETAHTGAVRSAVNRIRKQGRRQIERAGLGRLQKTWRGIIAGDRGEPITRRGTAIDPQGRVYSTAQVKGRVDDLLDVFQRGVVVVPKSGAFLAIPTALAGGRRAKLAGEYPEGTFRMVPVGGGGRSRGRARRYVLVHKERGEVWYILVPSVKLRRRLSLTPLVQRIATRIPADIDRRWTRAVRRLEQRVS